MPITVQATEGLYKREAEQPVIKELTEIILKINGAEKNPMGRKHLIASFSTFGEGRSFADGEPVSFVNVTLRVPTFSLDTHAKREAFVTQMTDLLAEKAEGRLMRDRVYINMIYGDGFWGVEGVTYTDGMLLAALLESNKGTR